MTIVGLVLHFLINLFENHPEVLVYPPYFAPGERGWPFSEYYTHLGTPKIVRPDSLEQSANLVFEMVRTIDRNVYARVRYKGQIFCSHYGLFPKTFEKQCELFKILFELAGLHSITDICRKHSLLFEEVATVIGDFHAHGLVEIGMKPFTGESPPRDSNC